MARMITFDEGATRFTQRVVGIVLDRGRVLLHRTDDMTFWALPGGRAELLESSPDTLVREMREEISVDVKVDRLLWLAENFFQHEGRAHHELGLYYLIHLPPGSPLRDQPTFLGREGDLAVHFEWHPIDSLENVVLFPSFLRTGLKAIPANIVHIVHVDLPEESARP
ncbi:MAG TPA: NUDIX hydrolase [Anaerolineae bacterium]|nr:NUDIX hydrolase [Anaerolineae bacterium]